MITRRATLTGLAGTAAAMLLAGGARAEPPQRILFVHGRAQGGRNADELRREWLGAFQRGLAAGGQTLPAAVEVRLPFYGDTLDELTARSALPLLSNVRSRGDRSQDEFLVFQEEVAQEIRRTAGITDAEIDAAYGDNPREKGPLNWEWVQAILAAIDRNAGGVSQAALEVFLRDVYLYISSSGVRRVIDGIIAAEAPPGPRTVVVGHSLGSVVAYNILTERNDYDVPLFVTLGSPLGIRAIRRRFAPLRYPNGTGGWFNAYDPRDVVALHALNAEHFDVSPAIENLGTIDNQTANRHGIIGYLDKPDVAVRVLTAR